MCGIEEVEILARVTSEQSPRASEGVNYMNTCTWNPLDQENSQFKG